MGDPRLERDVQKQVRLQRFPLRTLLLMILALIAFGWFWCQTHPGSEPKRRPIDVQIKP
jgi:hypothetical protein